MVVHELTSSKFEEFTSKGVVLVDFFADWCMPCMMMAPIVEELSEKLEGRVKFGKVDVGENQKIAVKFGVSSIPNFVLFKNGKVVNQLVGGMSAEELEERISEYI